MFIETFTWYLLRNGVIDEDASEIISARKRSEKLPIGELAVNIGLMTSEQAEKVHNMQKSRDRLFGDAAVEQGFLTADQVAILLKVHSRDDLLLLKILSEEALMDVDEALGWMRRFREDYKVSEGDFSLLTRGDLAAFTRVIGGISEASPFHAYTVCFLRIGIRFIDRNLFIVSDGPSGKLETYTQKFIWLGDRRMFVGCEALHETFEEIRDGLSGGKGKIDDEDGILSFIHLVSQSFVSDEQKLAEGVPPIRPSDVSVPTKGVPEGAPAFSLSVSAKPGRMNVFMSDISTSVG